jgi:hypothetical protein
MFRSGLAVLSGLAAAASPRDVQLQSTGTTGQAFWHAAVPPDVAGVELRFAGGERVRRGRGRAADRLALPLAASQCGYAGDAASVGL